MRLLNIPSESVKPENISKYSRRIKRPQIITNGFFLLLQYSTVRQPVSPNEMRQIKRKNEIESQYFSGNALTSFNKQSLDMTQGIHLATNGLFSKLPTDS